MGGSGGEWRELKESGGRVESRMKVEGRRGSKVQVSVHRQHSSHNATTILLMYACVALEQINFTITHEYNTSLLGLKWFANAFSELSSGHQRTHTIQLISQTTRIQIGNPLQSA